MRNTESNSRRSTCSRLAVQQLEDAPPERVIPLHTLKPRFPRAIPRTHAVLAIDHVQPERQRIEDLLRKVVLRSLIDSRVRDGWETSDWLDWMTGAWRQ